MLRARNLLAGAALLILAGCRVEVYDGLSQRDANEMTALLLASGLDAKRIEEKSGTFGVEVAESDFAIAVQIISDSGLPRPQFQSMDQIFDNDNLVSSPSEERARIAYAMSQELSRTVSEIDGVVSARVHLSSPSVDPLGRKTTQSSASVALHHDARLDTEGLVPRIKMLVSHAVDELDYDNVLVALFPVNGLKASSLSASDNAGDRLAIENEMEWPEGMQPADPRARVINPVAGAPFMAGTSPAVAAILLGGLLVLLFAGRSLFYMPAPMSSRSKSDVRRRADEEDGLS